MKKLFILTAVLTLTATAVGCNCCRGLFRGARAPEPCPPAVCPVPCAPACNPCDPCAVPTPGPEAYAPVPAT